MDKNEVINKLIQYKLLLCNNFELEKVILFGSYANGTNVENSDIDVAVIVKNVNSDYFKDTPLLWKLRRQIDDRIEPILFEKGRDESGFLSEIIRTGIEI
ncbi:MAG: nucleotidyltransferase domain-containing protein [Bacteroidetes bacterium]|nr:MAG: nucleotidyltransferase domain-containing protein [Bacteroidota bacterium]